MSVPNLHTTSSSAAATIRTQSSSIDSTLSVDHQLSLNEPIAINNDNESNIAAPQSTETEPETRSGALRRPRKERRGLLSSISLIPELNDSREYTEGMKNLIVFIIAFASMIGPMGTSIVYPAIEKMKEEFETSTMMINVSVGIYLMSLGVFPLWWSSFSERFGRRSIYIISFSMYLGFAIGCALSKTIKSFIVFRMLSGGCSASVQAVGAGTISDLFVTEKRGRALGVYYLGALLSPLTSPIIGALLMTRWSWRSTQWFLVILAGVIDLSVILLLPETLRTQDNKAFISQILAERRRNKEHTDEESQRSDMQDGEKQIDNDEEALEQDNVIERIASRVSHRSAFNEVENDHQSVVQEIYVSSNAENDPRMAEIRENDLRKLRSEIETAIDESSEKQTKWQLIKNNTYEYFLKPLKALNFLRYPPVALAISFSAISFGILYFVNMTLEFVFARPPYNWKSLYVGLAYIPNSITYIIASIYGGRWTDNLLKKYKKEHGFNAPEARISWNIFSAVVTFPIALLVIGWCFDYHTFWVTPLIGTALFGYASMMTIGPTVTYIVDSLPGRGATGVALNNLIRQTLATVAVFITDPVINGMNTGPAMSMFAGIVLLSSVVLLIIKRKGTYWRENYDLQKLYDTLD